MKVDIWSDIRCPFCYIGKRKFEKALSTFPQRNKVEVIWHSFELDPTAKTDTTKDVYTYLAEIKGQSREWSVQMHDNIKQTAYEVGLTYNFDKAVIANSFNAHRLIHMAKEAGKGDAAKEALLKAYFTDGKNIDDTETLAVIGASIGLDKQAVSNMLASKKYTKEVRADEDKAREYGINGVPFFVLNDKYGISGAQSPETFSSALQQAWAEYEAAHPTLVMTETDGDVCDVNGNC